MAPRQTLANAWSRTDAKTAVIVPSSASSQALEFSYRQLTDDILKLQTQFAELGISPQAAVSIAIPNSYEFIVAFLAAAW